MKMILLMADGARLDDIRRDLAELRAPGYTVLPVEEGAGRSGTHAGDRVHPGAVALVLVVEEAGRADRTFDALCARRDARGDSITRLFLLPVERRA